MFRPLLMCFTLCVVYATNRPKNRIHIEEPLSSHEHDDTHDHSYDHEAFLGRDQAKSFDELTPEESKHRLSLIVEKIDDDKDGFVTEDELKAWIKTTQKKQLSENVDRQFKEFDTNNDGMVSWEEYKNVTYHSYLEDPHAEEEYHYTHVMDRDERRFRKADKSGDLITDKEEFSAFIYPEDYEHMKDIIALEVIEDIDLNGDGLIDLKEYMDEMTNHQEKVDDPEWLDKEREQFTTSRDKNKDGKMDTAEVMEWIMPAESGTEVDTEAKHLINESDSDKDGKLTKDEILNKHDLFVGSQSVDFGEALVRHDEF